MENYTNRVITEGRNNMGMVRYCVVDRTNTPNAFCGSSFNTKKQGIEQLKRAKHLYPNHKWTLEAVFSIGGKEKKRKNLGDPLKESANADEFGTDEEFDAFMKWAMTEGSDMFSSAANEYVNGGNENELRAISLHYAKKFGLNQEVAFSIAKEAAEGLYDFMGGFQVVGTNNTNESKNMNKKLIRLTENDLHKIVKESVNRILNEVGDTKRGQYMLGRLKNRQSNGGGKFARGINYNDAGDYAHKANGNSYSDDYQQGYEDEEKYGRNANSTWDGDKYRRMKFNYDTKQMEDMDNIGKRFIDFIEKHDGGVLMQTIVDYESGNQTGKPQSPLGEIVPYFEENVLGYECTPEMKKAIKDAYNQWWFYAQDQLMPDEEH